MAAYQKEMKHALAVLAYARENERPVIVYDLETEGLSASKHKVIEICARKMDPDTLEIQDSIKEYINPGRLLDGKIKEITGITDEFLEDYLPERYVFPKILEFFGGRPIVMGHNVGFDNRFLAAMYERAGEELSFASEGDPSFQCVIDTCQMSREALRKPADVSSHRLCDVARYYGADAGLSFHEAGDDVVACYRIFKAMLASDASHAAGEKVAVASVGFFMGYRGHNRIYVHTSAGSIFYDGMDKVWDSRELDISAVDMEDVRRQLHERYGAGDDSSLFETLYREHCRSMEEMVGTSCRFDARDDALKYAKKMQGRHFDVHLSEEDGYAVELSKFCKGRMGRMLP